MPTNAPAQQVRIELGDRSYPILIGEGLIPQITGMALPKAHAALVVTNTTVGPLYAQALVEALRPHAGEGASGEANLSSAEHEAKMVSGAIRTDLILSAEIMAIALAEVSQEGIGLQAAILAVVAVAITIGVYGLVGLIVKMDDIGLHLAKGGSGARRAIGRGLVRAMPKLLSALSAIGVAAMIWVGGGIVLHGLHEFHQRDQDALVRDEHPE